MTVHCRGADFSVMGLWSYTLVMRDHINKLRKIDYAELVTECRGQPGHACRKMPSSGNFLTIHYDLGQWLLLRGSRTFYFWREQVKTP